MVDFYGNRCRQGERPALIIRFRRACPGSERTSDGYIERPLIPPISAGIAFGDSRGNGGRVASGGLVAASCIPDWDKPNGRFYSQTVAFTGGKSCTCSKERLVSQLCLNLELWRCPPQQAALQKCPATVRHYLVNSARQCKKLACKPINNYCNTFLTTVP